MYQNQRRDQRVLWLLAHPDLWVDLPSDRDDVTDRARVGLVALGEAMVTAGLYARTTALQDRTWGIRLLIGVARQAEQFAAVKKAR